MNYLNPLEKAPTWAVVAFPGAFDAALALGTRTFLEEGSDAYEFASNLALAGFSYTVLAVAAMAVFSSVFSGQGKNPKEHAA